MISCPWASLCSQASKICAQMCRSLHSHHSHHSVTTQASGATGATGDVCLCGMGACSPARFELRHTCHVCQTRGGDALRLAEGRVAAGTGTGTQPHPGLLTLASSSRAQLPSFPLIPPYCSASSSRTLTPSRSRPRHETRRRKPANKRQRPRRTLHYSHSHTAFIHSHPCEFHRTTTSQMSPAVAWQRPQTRFSPDASA